MLLQNGKSFIDTRKSTKIPVNIKSVREKGKEYV